MRKIITKAIFGLAGFITGATVSGELIVGPFYPYPPPEWSLWVSILQDVVLGAIGAWLLVKSHEWVETHWPKAGNGTWVAVGYPKDSRAKN